ncbi:ScbR family autoregulator-binding transcription factor [Streptomyces sp. NPDC008265]|uniref:ScbR family autoregulator-binding transcription factor n=1 Tax=Streptomyces sp. NPDC008265 TaxID=3364824 RepID=UPI0036EE9C01
MVKQERGERTREALVRAAAEVFAEQGYVTASIAAVSRHAGISAGGLHFHFASKPVLAGAVQDRAAQVLRQVTAVAGGAAAAAGVNPLQVLVDSTHALTALLAGDVVVRAGFGLCADPAFGGGVDLRRQWRRWVEETLAAAAREGCLAEGLLPRDAARVVVAATVGLEVLGAGDAEWAHPRTLTRIWALLLPRLAAPAVLDALLPGGTPPPAGTPRTPHRED